MKNLIFLSVVLLTGCANVLTQADIDAHDRSCDLRQHPELALVKGKIPLSNSEGKNVSLQMLTLDRTPTDSEKVAIIRTEELGQPCRQKSEDNRNKIAATMPELVSLASTSGSALKGNLAMLYLGKITYAQHNGNVQLIFNKYTEAATKIVSAYQQRQQAQAQAFTNIYLQEIMRQPTFTSCTALGNTINCNSR